MLARTTNVVGRAVPSLPCAMTLYLPARAGWYVAVTVPSGDAVCGGPVNTPLGERISKVIVSDGWAPVSVSVNCWPCGPEDGLIVSLSGGAGGILSCCPAVSWSAFAM